MGCPWCGCGWLFSCMDCRKAYTFARGVEVDLSLEELAARDLTNCLRREPSGKQVSDWNEWMRILLKDVQLDHSYVYLDGFYIDAETPSVNIEGWYARHNLPWIPQVRALKNKAILDETISSISYWRVRAHNDSENG
jgi:hypothetical protein